MRPAIHSACEMLGLDPLYVANEGKLIAIVAPDPAEAVLAAMRAHEHGCKAAIVGKVVAEHRGLVTARTGVVDVPAASGCRASADVF